MEWRTKGHEIRPENWIKKQRTSASLLVKLTPLANSLRRLIAAGATEMDPRIAADWIRGRLGREKKVSRRSPMIWAE